MKSIARSNFKFFLPAGLVLLGLVIATTAYANPFYTAPKASSATATSTLSFVTTGAATSTTVYDSYESPSTANPAGGTNETAGGNITRPDDVTVAMQGVASSSITIVNVICEYSEDRVDWYQNNVASSTSSSSISVVNSFTFLYASSTNTVGGGGVSAAYNKFFKAFVCPVLMRYVRVVVSVTGTNAGIGVYVAILPKKQRN